MKIVQNPKSGELNIKLNENEKYDMEEHLDALMAFVSEQAVKTHRLIILYEKNRGTCGCMRKKTE